MIAVVTRARKVWNSKMTQWPILCSYTAFLPSFFTGMVFRALPKLRTLESLEFGFTPKYQSRYPNANVTFVYKPKYTFNWAV